MKEKIVYVSGYTTCHELCELQELRERERERVGELEGLKDFHFTHVCGMGVSYACKTGK